MDIAQKSQTHVFHIKKVQHFTKQYLQTKICENTGFRSPVFYQIMRQFCAYTRKYKSVKTRIFAFLGRDCDSVCTDKSTS